MQTVTIVARNYLPRARVLARTYKRHNPADSFCILVVDAVRGELPDGPDHEIVVPADLPLAPDEFDRMALIYDVTELCTAVKPWALEMLLDRGARVATYLDPDIAVYDSLELIEKLSLDHGVVLTPHSVDPMPRDGLTPTEADIMAAGAFNLGFLAVSHESRPMLAWWEERLLRDCVVAPERMLFVDQRWVDLVPGYFDHIVLTDPTYNVAYWNLHSRTVVRSGRGIELEGHGPLHFFHFSGYEPDRPWVLTKYHVDRPRVLMSEQPVVRELCDEYAGWITDPAVGGSRGRATGDTAYRFDRLPNGVRVTRPMRLALRKALIESEVPGGPDRLRPPGWSDGEAVVAWFREPAAEGSPVNRYLQAVWETRPDVQAVYLGPQGVHGVRLVEWAWRETSRDHSLVTTLLPSMLELTRPDPVSELDGVNLAGYFTAEMGVGEVGRMLVDGVRAAELPFSTSINTNTVSRQQAAFAGATDRTQYRVTIAAINADQLPGWVRDHDPLRRRGYTIGVWCWEVEEFSDPEAVAMVDEIWTISAFARDAIAASTDKPVHVLPLPVREPGEPGELDRAALGIPDGPYVLFAFDYLSVFERKNPLGLVEAHARAFPDGDGPTLVIKSMNGDRFRSHRDRLRQACSGRGDVVVVDQHLDAAQMSALMAGCTAYVSLHRSEGYGLTLAEAMARGRPVIATAYSGNLDFMDDTDSLLVPARMISVPRGTGPYPDTTRWADPDLDVAAGHLRWVVDHPEQADELGRLGAVSIREKAALDQTAAFIRERVEAALATGRAGGRRGGARDGEPSRAERKIGQAKEVIVRPAAPSRRLGPALGRYDEQQQERLRAVLEAVRIVNRRADRALDLARDVRDQVTGLPDPTEEVSRLRWELSSYTAQLAALRDAVESLRSTESGLVDHVQQVVADVSASLRSLREATARLDAEQVARPHTSTAAGLRRVDADGEEYLGYTDPSAVPRFGELFRGDEEFVRNRLRPYVSILEGAGPVLDVGCGRGELLALMAGAGVEARGVDTDPWRVERARAAGATVTLGDGVAELAAVADAAPGSLGAVTAIQVAEHLGPAALTRLFEAARVALRPGGLLVVETVNPHSPPALKAFWLDLDHVRPLYPEALVMLARDSGFATARTFFPAGGPDLDDNLRGCGEYALVATR